MSSSKVFLAGIAGLAAGIALGVLFAPAKGTKTRKRLKKKIMSIADIYQEELLNSIDNLTGEKEEVDEDEADEQENVHKEATVTQSS